MAAPMNLSTATSLEQQAYLTALELQKLELAIAPENRPNNAQVTFDTEGGTVAIAVTLNTVMTVEAGKAVIAATTYLA